MSDFVSFNPSGMFGPGGAAAVSYGGIGPGGVATSASDISQGVAAPVTKGLRIPPAVWMFVFLIVGYWGVHQSLKAV